MIIQLLFKTILFYILLYSKPSVMLFEYNPNIHWNNELIVLLGCSMPYLQNQRVQSVLSYIETTSNPITLYLSGGSKYGNTESESSIMQRKIQKLYHLIGMSIISFRIEIIAKRELQRSHAKIIEIIS